MKEQIRFSVDRALVGDELHYQANKRGMKFGDYCRYLLLEGYKHTVTNPILGQEISDLEARLASKRGLQ